MSDNRDKMPYEGHRKRLRNKVKKFGFEMLEPYERLELLLFYVIPRCDTYLIAKRLISSFGGIYGVLNASEEELKSVDGIGDNAAFFIRQLLPLFKQYMKEMALPKMVLDSCEKIVRFMRSYTLGIDKEKFYVLLLNSRKTLLICKEVGGDESKSISIRISEVARLALVHNASYVIIAHNHPSGYIYPSKEDVKSTGMMKAALETVGKTLSDSIIFDEYSYYSFIERRGGIDLRKM